MNLFKNKVGRPSNVIIRKRRIFYTCIIVIIIFVVYLITNANDFKGAIGDFFTLQPKVKYTDNVSSNKHSYDTKIEITTKFLNISKKSFFYKQSIYSGKTVLKTTECKPIEKDKIKGALTLKLNNMYISTSIYNDSECKDRINSFETTKYQLKNSNKKQKVFTATFKKNGADKIGNTKLSCKTNNKSCTVIAPTIEKENYITEGWSTSKYKDAKYKVGQKITLTKNAIFYAKVKKDDGNEIIEEENNSSSIKFSKVKEPLKLWDTNIITITGLKEDETFTVKSSNSEIIKVSKQDNNSIKLITLNSGKSKITIKTETGKIATKTYIVEKYKYLNQARALNGIKRIQTINEVKIYTEKKCNTSIANKYVYDFRESPSYVKNTIKSIFILTKDSYDNISENKNKEIYSNFNEEKRSIDIICNEYYSSDLSHQLGHALDSYHYLYNNEYISDKPDFKKLYNSFKQKQTVLRKNESYDNAKEFFADSYSMYFHKNLAKTNKLSKTIWKNYKYDNNLEANMKKILNEVKEIKW